MVKRVVKRTVKRAIKRTNKMVKRRKSTRTNKGPNKGPNKGRRTLRSRTLRSRRYYTKRRARSFRGGYNAVPVLSYNTSGNPRTDAINYQNSQDTAQQSNNNLIGGGDDDSRITIPQFPPNPLDGPDNANSGSLMANTTNVQVQSNARNDHFATDK